MHRTGKDIPLMLSATVNDASGRLLSGQTLEAFLISVAHAPILSIGLNCSFGADQMLPVLRNLHRMLTERAGENGKRIFISCHPNAGLPNSMGQYDVNPEQFAQTVRPMIEEGLADIIGGCCGTTPEHIKALVDICI
jgi:5-methyltetrahydrofolate--homocysteine methyltransferase